VTRSFGLALHTTTPELGLALGADHDALQLQVTELGRSMASELQLCLAAFLQPHPWSSLDFLAVACGPGGFTGTRLGMVTARTLAQQLCLPLFSISTLAALAQQQWQQARVPSDRAIALEMKAQRGQCFTALYRLEDGLPQAVIADQVCTADAWQAQLQAQLADAPDLAIRSAAGPTIERLSVEGDVAAAVASLWSIAHRRYGQGERPVWSAALPFYGQHPVSL
jgi:tRNA threonylcarbamoyl adenosine modification protein YeaZ